jgi:hypothetical protein
MTWLPISEAIEKEKVLTCISNVKHLHAVPSRLEVLGASCKNTKKSLEDLLIVWRFCLQYVRFFIPISNNDSKV